MFFIDDKDITNSKGKDFSFLINKKRVPVSLYPSDPPILT